MHTQSHVVEKAVVTYHPLSGKASIRIRDKKMFPNGFDMTMPANSPHEKLIREAFATDIAGPADWIDDAGTTFEEFEERNRIPERIYLGMGKGRQWIHHQPFSFSSQSSHREKGFRARPESMIITGGPATGKTTLLYFLAEQIAQRKDYPFPVIRMNLADGSANIFRPEKTSAFRPGSTNITTLDLMDALDILYTTKEEMVVLVDGMDDAFGRYAVAAGALNDLIRSRGNRNLCFVVAKMKADDAEKDLYTIKVEAYSDDEFEGPHYGSYRITGKDSMFHYENLEFRTPHADKMFPNGQPGPRRVFFTPPQS